MGGLQKALELACIAALSKEAVGIVPLWEPDQAGVNVSLLETLPEAMRGLLSAAIRIGIEGQINGPGCVAQLDKLACIQMGS